MRRLSGLFPEIASVENLWRAWRDFRRGKRRRPSVQAFEPNADCQVLSLHRSLETGTYRPAGYRLVEIRVPKRRLIAAAPVRDRVIHHAVHRVLSPLLDLRFIDTTFACLPRRGSHRAILSLVAALRQYRYVLCLDVRRYFLSIDREILLTLMARRLKDARLLGLLRVIADSGEGLYRSPGVPELLALEPGFPPTGCGLPIGNLTSQWWGNHYLDGLDHFAKRELKIPHYQRYMDDFTLVGDSVEQLLEGREAIEGWLARERRLQMKNAREEPRSTRSRFTYLGYTVSQQGVLPSPSQLRRMRHRLSQVILEGGVDLARSVDSYRGLATFGLPGS